MDLNQRKLFTRKEFRLTESGLLVKNRSLTEAQEVVIPYEELATNKAIREVKTDMTMVIISGLIGIVFCVNLIDKLGVYFSIGSPGFMWGWHHPPIFQKANFDTYRFEWICTNIRRQTYC
jgi:hypothetical protein